MLSLKWDKRFLSMATLVSTWSKDFSTKVGAVIADSENRVISVGYNGPPRGLLDEEWTQTRESKNQCTLHAESNAIDFSNQSLKNCTIYVTHPCCSACAARIIQSGITRVVCIKPSEDFMSRWKESVDTAKQMLYSGKVSYEEVYFNQEESKDD